ncbi:hypothetical protein Bca4012_021064 [Brassica carinata]
MPSRKNRGNTQWTAWLTLVIVLACIAVFIVVMLINDFPTMFAGANGDCVPRFLRRFSFQPLRENPLLGPSSSTLEKMGALEWRKVVKGNEMGALCGSMPVSFTLCSIWSSSVSASSSIRVGLIYLIAGFGGSILSALFLQNSIPVGASGALLGLLGAMLYHQLDHLRQQVWGLFINNHQTGRSDPLVAIFSTFYGPASSGRSYWWHDAHGTGIETVENEEEDKLRDWE